MNLCHKEFERVVSEQPQATAIIDGSKHYTYAQLSRLANQIACLLDACQLEKEAVVGVYCQPRVYLIASIIAIWKVGKTYCGIPVSKDVPQERIQSYIDEAKPHVILVDETTRNDEVLNQVDNRTVVCDLSDEQVLKKYEAHLSYDYDLNRRAYIIFTSGSTGKPKGVVIEHTGLMNCFTENIRILTLNHSDKVAQFAQVAFDAHLMEIFIALLSGASLVLVPNCLKKSPHDLAELYKAMSVSVSIFTPSMLKVLDPNYLTDIRVVTSTGEKLDRATFLKWQLDRITFTDGYGPAEVSICTSVGLSIDHQSINCGRPIKGLRVWVVKPDGAVKVGEQGEIYIAGEGLAREYLNNLELTRLRFVNIKTREGVFRAFKTNDLGFLDEKGQIHITGRKDRQIKIHGKLYHPAETEFVLKIHPLVESAYVVATINDQGNVIIKAFINSKNNVVSDEELSELYRFVKEKLPQYMLPNGWVFVKRKVSMSGKFDWKKVINQSHVTRRIMHPLHEKPRDDIERKLLEMWRQELGDVSCDDGIHDDFFYRGSSIQCACFINVVNNYYLKEGLTISLSEFIDEPTIASLARIIRVKKQISMLNPLIKLNEYDESQEHAKVPIHFIHSVLGDVKSDSRVFAGIISNKLPLFGLQCVGLTDEINFPCSIEGIARIYVSAIKSAQKVGPYIIMGWSAGGLLGYEVVRQFESMGEQAYLLAVDIEYFTFWQNASHKAHAQRVLELVEGAILPMMNLVDYHFELAELAAYGKSEQVVQLFDRLKNCAQEQEDIRKTCAVRNILLGIQCYDYRKKISSVSLFSTEKTQQKCGTKNLEWPDELLTDVYHQEGADHYVMLDEKSCKVLVQDVCVAHHAIELKSKMRDEVEKIKAHYIHDFQGIKDEFAQLKVTGVNDDFSVDFSSNPVRMFIQGLAFCGSSTLVKYLCYQWANANLWNGQIDLLLCFDLQREYVGDTANIDLATMINQYCTTQIYQKTIVSFVDSTNFVRHKPSKVVVIVDNVHHANSNSKALLLLFEIINNPELNVIMVGRHNNIHKLNVNMKVLVSGFAQSEVYSYVKKYFRFNHSLAAKVLCVLNAHDGLVTLLENPYYCSLFCGNAQELFACTSDSDFIGVSKTVMLKMLMDKLWVKYLLDTLRVLYTPTSLEIATGFQRLRSSMETFLQIIAFSSLEKKQKSIPSKLVGKALKMAFREDDALNYLLNNLVNSGLIHEVRSGPVKDVSFLAPLLKQWFAACYWVRFITSGERESYSNAVNKLRVFSRDPDFFKVWLLVVGLLREKQGDFNHYHFLQLLFEKVKNVGDLDSDEYYCFMRECLREAGLLGSVEINLGETISEQDRLLLLGKLSGVRKIEKSRASTKLATVFFQLSNDKPHGVMPIDADIVGCKIHLPYFYKPRINYHKKIHANFLRKCGSNIYTILHGSSGMGKSTMALAYANTNSEKYPGGIYWLDATNVDTLEMSWRKVARSFSLNSDLSLNDLVLKLQPILDDLDKSLFVLDNVSSRIDVEHLLLFEKTSMTSCHDILVTTENQPSESWDEHYPLELKLLDRTMSKQIIIEILTHFSVDVSDVEADHLAMTLCDWPFFIVQSAYTIKSTMKVEDYIYSLVEDEESNYVEKLLLEQNSLPSSLQYKKSAMDAHRLTCQSVEKVAPGATSLLKLLAFYSDSNIPMVMLSNYKNFYLLIKTLVDFHLAQINIHDNTISLLPLRKRLVMQQISHDGEYQIFLLQASEIMMQRYQLNSAMMLDVAQCRQYLLNAFEILKVHRDGLCLMPDSFQRLTLQIAYFLTYGTGEYTTVIKEFKNASEQFNKPLFKMTLYNCLAYCYIYRGDFEKSINCIVMVSKLYLELKSEMIELPELFVEQSLRMCMTMGALFRLKGKLDRTLELFAFFAQQIGYAPQVSHTMIDFLINYGFNLMLDKQHDTAKKYYKKAKGLLEQEGGKNTESKLIFLKRCKADLELECNNPKKALNMYLAVELHYRNAYHECHNNLAVMARCIGDCYLQLKKPAEAKRKYEAALEIHKKNGFKAVRMLGVIYRGLILACSELGDEQNLLRYKTFVSSVDDENRQCKPDDVLLNLERAATENVFHVLQENKSEDSCVLQ